MNRYWLRLLAVLLIVAGGLGGGSALLVAQDEAEETPSLVAEEAPDEESDNPTDVESEDAASADTPEVTPVPPPSPLAPPADASATKQFYFPTRGIKDVTFSFESRAPLETIVGVTNKAEGKFAWNEETGESSIEIVVDATSLKTGIDLRDEHLRGMRWLDAERYPTIEFRSTEVTPIPERDGWFAVSGEMTIHGASHEVAAVVEARVIPQSAETEEAGFGKGDVAKVRGEFELKLSDYGIIVPQQEIAKVANTVTIRLDLFASADPGRFRLAEEAKSAEVDNLSTP